MRGEARGRVLARLRLLMCLCSILRLRPRGAKQPLTQGRDGLQNKSPVGDDLGKKQVSLSPARGLQRPHLPPGPSSLGCLRGGRRVGFCSPWFNLGERRLGWPGRHLMLNFADRAHLWVLLHPEEGCCGWEGPGSWPNPVAFSSPSPSRRQRGVPVLPGDPVGSGVPAAGRAKEHPTPDTAKPPAYRPLLRQPPPPQKKKLICRRLSRPKSIRGAFG